MKGGGIIPLMANGRVNPYKKNESISNLRV